MMVDNAIQHMDENLQRLQALQEKVASGKQFQRASDHPSRAAAALSLRSSLDASQAYLNTAQIAEDWMSATDFALKQTVDIAARAMTLASRGVSDSMGLDERSGLAAELDELLDQVIGQGNSSHAGNYLFAGFRTDAAPFSGADTNGDGRYDTILYRGAAINPPLVLPAPESIQRSINPGHTIVQNIDGPTVFYPLAKAVIEARDALLANDPARIQASVSGLSAALEQVSEARTTNGARQRQVQLVGERIEKAQLELKSLLTLKEDANMAEAISNLRHQETVYQSVLEVGQRAISTMSLFDMLR
jgi:flagellar hook-associated protein 3 FlgL